MRGFPHEAVGSRCEMACGCRPSLAARVDSKATSCINEPERQRGFSEKFKIDSPAKVESGPASNAEEFDMRTILLTVALAVAGLFSLGYTAPAHAGGVRVFVDLGDVYFTAGRPYNRHGHAPLYVARYAYGPRYYYNAPQYPAYYRAPYRQHDGYRRGYAKGHAYRADYRGRDHDRHDYRRARHDRNGHRGQDGHGNRQRDRDDDNRNDRGGRGDHRRGH